MFCQSVFAADWSFIVESKGGVRFLIDKSSVDGGMLPDSIYVEYHNFVLSSFEKLSKLGYEATKTTQCPVANQSECKQILQTISNAGSVWRTHRLPITVNVRLIGTLNGSPIDVINTLKIDGASCMSKTTTDFNGGEVTNLSTGEKFWFTGSLSTSTTWDQVVVWTCIEWMSTSSKSLEKQRERQSK
jgi:hypothetical protein